MASPPGDTIYAIQDVPGKGKGLIATRDIVRGTRILCEEPLLRLRHFEMQLGAIDLGAFLSLLARRVEALSPEKWHQFLALYNPGAGVPSLKYLEVLHVNGIPLDVTVPARSHPSQAINTTDVISRDDGLVNVKDVGIFHYASRINHDCERNTYHIWNDKIERYTVHASRNIAKGDEITIEYLDPYIPRCERQALLRDHYGFECTCRLCTLPRQLVHEHDKLMVKLQEHRDATVGRLNTLRSLGMPPLCFMPRGAEHKAMMPDLARALEEIN